MTAYQRRLLAAIDAESRERRGPCPAWLAAVAMNIKTQAERDHMDGVIGALLREELLSYQPDAGRGEGLELTPHGLMALDEKPEANQKVIQSIAKPLIPKPAQVDESAQAQPAARAKRQAVIAEAASKTRQRDDIVTHDRSPVLYDLLADLGGLVAERLHELRGGDDVDALGRWRDAGLRIQRQTGGPQS